MSSEMNTLFKALFDAMGWTFEEIGDREGFCLRPPAKEDLLCPHCSGPMLEIVVYTGADDNHGHCQPCGCRMVPNDFFGAINAPESPA